VTDLVRHAEPFEPAQPPDLERVEFVWLLARPRREIHDATLVHAP